MNLCPGPAQRGFDSACLSLTPAHSTLLPRNLVQSHSTFVAIFTMVDQYSRPSASTSPPPSSSSAGKLGSQKPSKPGRTCDNCRKRKVSLKRVGVGGLSGRFDPNSTFSLPRLYGALVGKHKRWKADHRG